MEQLVWPWQGNAPASSTISMETPTAGPSKRSDARSPPSGDKEEARKCRVLESKPAAPRELQDQVWHPICPYPDRSTCLLADLEIQATAHERSLLSATAFAREPEYLQICLPGHSTRHMPNVQLFCESRPFAGVHTLTFSMHDGWFAGLRATGPAPHPVPGFASCVDLISFCSRLPQADILCVCWFPDGLLVMRTTGTCCCQ